MRPISKLLAGWLILITLAACSAGGQSLPPGAAPTLTLPPLATLPAGTTIPVSRMPPLIGNWQLTLNQSGGFVGVSRQVEVLSSGEMTAIDYRSSQSVRTHLSSDDLTVLIRLISATKYNPIQTPATCADCFLYHLEIVSASEKFQVDLNQIDIANTGLQPLVDYLTRFFNPIGK
jgi:hypothetical protein